MRKRKYDKDFFMVIRKTHWVLIPTIIISYNPNEFLETGVYTKAFSLTFRWLIFMMGAQIQESY
jgi:hypothetical protein